MADQLTNFKYNDYTDELLLIPNQWGLLTNMGLFTTDSVSSSVVQFDESNSTLSLITDQRRGERKRYNREDYSKLHTVGIPHFPFDDVIKPSDIINNRMPGTKDQPQTLANVRMKKMERFRRNHAATLEYARALALRGLVYNPNGTNDVQNWYTEFNVTQKSVGFALDTAGTDIIAKVEEVIAHIQDNIQSGESISDFVAYVSPEFFTSLIGHPEVKEAYKYYASNSEPLRNRQVSELGARYREFEYGGMRFIEYRGSFPDRQGAQQRLIPANEGYVVPMGTTDTFMTYFAPADKFEYIHTAGLEQYMWEYEAEKGRLIELESESNFLNVVRRPQAVVKITRV